MYSALVMAVALVTIFGVLWFRIPFVGSPLMMLSGASLFLLAALGLIDEQSLMAIPPAGPAVPVSATSHQ